MESKIYQLRDTRVLYQKEIFGEKNVKNSAYNSLYCENNFKIRFYLNTYIYVFY